MGKQKIQRARWYMEEIKEMKSRGLGDDIAKITAATRLDKLSERISEIITGNKDCGCSKRQEKLNKMFPHKDK